MSKYKQWIDFQVPSVSIEFNAFEICVEKQSVIDFVLFSSSVARGFFILASTTKKLNKR